jgi:hypothetical protein
VANGNWNQDLCDFRLQAEATLDAIREFLAGDPVFRGKAAETWDSEEIRPAVKPAKSSEEIEQRWGLRPGRLARLRFTRTSVGFNDSGLELEGAPEVVRRAAAFIAEALHETCAWATVIAGFKRGEDPGLTAEASANLNAAVATATGGIAALDAACAFRGTPTGELARLYGAARPGAVKVAKTSRR